MPTHSGWTRWTPLIGATVAAVTTLVAAGRDAVIALPMGSATALVVFTVAILALLTGAVAAAVVPLPGVIGPLLAAVTVVRLAPLWVGWQVSQQWVRGVAAVVMSLLGPALLALVLQRPDGSLPAKRAILIALGVVGVPAVLAAVWRDPLRDPACWNDCTGPRPSQPWAAGADGAASVVMVAELAVALAGIAALGVAAIRGKDRSWTLAVTTPAALAGAAAGLSAYGRLIGEPPDGRLATVASVALDVALACLGAGTLAIGVRATRRLARVARLAERLRDAPTPGSLGTALGQQLGQEVWVSYRLTGSDRLVDANGAEAEAPPGSARIELRRHGQQLALVHLTRPVEDWADLERGIGAAAQIAVDNARLQAELAARLVELTDSRTRIVEAGDSTRRRIERDLHDGAQSSLVALLTVLALARAGSSQAGSAADAASLDQLIGRTSELMDRLRDLTHGIFPAVLDQLGLTAALKSLAGERSTATQVTVTGAGEALLEEGWREAARAAYLFVAEALAATPDGVEVAVRIEEGVLRVMVAPMAGEPPIAITDRVGAAGGVVAATKGAWRAEIPCVS